MDAFFATLAVLSFVAVMGGVTGLLTVDKIKNLFGKNKSQPPEPTTLQSPSQRMSAQDLQVIVLHKIQQVSKFGVLSEDFDSQFIYEDDRKIRGVGLPLTAVKIKVSYRGTAVCGCDLSRAVYADDSTNGRIKIVIPCAEILHIHEIPGTLSAEKKTDRIFSPDVDLEKYDRCLAKSLDEMRQTLIDEGITRRANDFMRGALKEFIASVNREISAEIIFIGESPAPERLSARDNLPRLGR